MNLPHNPALLLSFINTELLDNFADLDNLCKELNFNRNEIEFTLRKIEYLYNEKCNQFKIAEQE